MFLFSTVRVKLLWSPANVSADAGELEPEHLLQHQAAAAGQRHEAGARREERRGFRLTARHRRQGILWQ